MVSGSPQVLRGSEVVVHTASKAELPEGSLAKRRLGSRATQALHLGQHPWRRATSAPTARGLDLQARVAPRLSWQSAATVHLHDGGALSGRRMRPQSPDQPQSRFLRLSQCRHVTVLDTVGSSGQEPDGLRTSLASASSPAWRAEEGRTLQQWVCAPWGGRGGLERGAAIAPRACPARGCSHLESGCPHP